MIAMKKAAGLRTRAASNTNSKHDHKAAPTLTQFVKGRGARLALWRLFPTAFAHWCLCVLLFASCGVRDA